MLQHPLTGAAIRADEITDADLDKLMREILDMITADLGTFFHYSTGEVHPYHAAAWLENQILTGDIFKLQEHLTYSARIYGQRLGSPIEQIYEHRLKNHLTYVNNVVDIARDNNALELLAPFKGAFQSSVTKTAARLLEVINKVTLPVLAAIRQTQNPSATNFEFDVEPLGSDSEPISFSPEQANDIQETLYELIRNATKYAATRVSVRFDMQERCFVVTNDGISIPEGFTPFETPGLRAANVGQIEGTGFGLTSLKPLADKHGWRITYTSTDGKTEFRVLI